MDVSVDSVIVRLLFFLTRQMRVYRLLLDDFEFDNLMNLRDRLLCRMLSSLWVGLLMGRLVCWKSLPGADRRRDSVCHACTNF